MWEEKEGEKKWLFGQKGCSDHCSKFRVRVTSEEKSLSHNTLVTSEAISAGPAAGCVLQLISIRVPFPKD